MAATVELTTPEAQATGARSALYRTLARAFRPPTPELYQEIRAGRITEEVQQALAALPYSLDAAGDLAGAPSYEELESAYLALFEVGGEQGAPCFLYEGEQGGGRMKVLEEVLRFYHYFGLRLSQEKHERPDHLATELEFMHALTFQAASGLAAGQGVDSLRAAQRDFLRLHLADFASFVASKSGALGAPFYPALARCAAALCERDLAYLRE